MPNAWFRPIPKEAPLPGYNNWDNEGWIHWSTASSAFRTGEELATYGIDHAAGTFPDFPLPLRDQIVAWKVPLKIGTLQLANSGNADGSWAIARHVVLPRGIACKMTGILAACQLQDYAVIGLTYDRDRIEEGTSKQSDCHGLSSRKCHCDSSWHECQNPPDCLPTTGNWFHGL